MSTNKHVSTKYAGLLLVLVLLGLSQAVSSGEIPIEDTQNVVLGSDDTQWVAVPAENGDLVRLQTNEELIQLAKVPNSPFIEGLKNAAAKGALVGAAVGGVGGGVAGQILMPVLFLGFTAGAFAGAYAGLALGGATGAVVYLSYHAALTLLEQAGASESADTLKSNASDFRKRLPSKLAVSDFYLYTKDPDGNKVWFEKFPKTKASFKQLQNYFTFPKTKQSLVDLKNYFTTYEGSTVQRGVNAALATSSAALDRVRRIAG